MTEYWLIEARWWIDMLNNSITNIQDWVNPWDAVSLQQVETLIPSSFVKVDFSNSNTINSWTLTPITTFNTTALIISDPSDFVLTNSWITVVNWWRYRVEVSLYIESASGNRLTPSLQFTLWWVAQNEIWALAYARNAAANNETWNYLSSVYDIPSNTTVWVSTQQLGWWWVANLIWLNSVFIIQKIG